MENILIFDIDGTVFDTDYLRIKRRKSFKLISDDDFSKVKYIEGFEKIFLNPNNDLYLYKNKVLFISNSPYIYVNKMVEKAKLNTKKITIKANCSYDEKCEVISEFLYENYKGDSKIIAFGDDEKDALIYSRLNIPYLLVNNYYGYNNYEYLKNEISYCIDFRSKFNYDIIRIEKDFNSEFFDDVVIYYTKKYDKNSDHDFRIENQNCIPKKYGESKREFISKYLDLFINDYKNILNLNKNIYFAKIPGHNEIETDNNSPCSKLIAGLCNLYGEEKNLSYLLTKKYKTDKLAGKSKEERNIDQLLNSIEVKEKLKGKTIYLFDDIATTGSSFIASTQKLYEYGAGHVVCFCLGRTKFEHYDPKQIKINNRYFTDKLNKFLLFLKCFDGVGDKFIRNLILNYSPKKLSEIIENLKSNDDIREFISYHKFFFYRKPNIEELFSDKNIELAKKKRINICKRFNFLSWYDYQYFHNFDCLKESNDFPNIVFYEGNIQLLISNNICAIVGTREPCKNSIDIEKKIVKQLVKNENIILSGMASGCDTIAHIECIKNNGKTISILGTGVDVVYPKNNYEVYNAIKERGLILSEEMPGFTGAKYSFVKRDRLQAAASTSLYVIETNEDGGTMHSAYSAIKYNKEVYVVNPTLIFNGKISGNKKLLLNNNVKIFNFC